MSRTATVGVSDPRPSGKDSVHRSPRQGVPPAIPGRDGPAAPTVALARPRCPACGRLLLRTEIPVVGSSTAPIPARQEGPWCATCGRELTAVGRAYALICHWAAEGLSTRQIATRLRVSSGSVKNARTRWGVAYKQGASLPEALVAVRRGESIRAVARRLPVDRRTIQRALRRSA